MAVSYISAAAAWLVIRDAVERNGGSRDYSLEQLDKYFKVPKNDSPQPACDTVRYGHDELRCRTCARIWAIDEEPPLCRSRRNASTSTGHTL